MFKKLNYKDAGLFLICNLLCLTFRFCLPTQIPVDTAVIIGLMYNGFSPILCALAFISSNCIFFNLNHVLLSLFPAAITATVFSIYDKFHKKPKFEIVLYILVSLALAVYKYPLTYNFICVFLTLLISLISLQAVRVLFVNKFSYKTTDSELLCVCTFVVVTGIGVTNLTSAEIWKSVLILFILYSSTIGGAACVTGSVVLALPLAVYSRSFLPVGCMAVIAVCALYSVNISKLLAASLTIFIDFAISWISGINYTYISLIYTLVPVAIFVFTPENAIKSMGDKLYLFKKRQLVRAAINRNRMSVSSKLYEISGAFKEIQNSLYEMQSVAPDEDSIKNSIVYDVKTNVCTDCTLYSKCLKKNFPQDDTLFRLISIGIAKGKLSLVDIPKEFAENCAYTNGMLYELNKHISSYKETLMKLSDVNVGRELISLQSEGLSDVLKNIAFEMSQPIRFNDKLKAKIEKVLTENGFYVSEILVYGDDDFQIEIMLDEKIFTLPVFTRLIEKATEKPLTIVRKLYFSAELICVTLKPSPAYDTVFGVNAMPKDDNNCSGDTHSIIKIDEGKFLIAINDGMGTGVKAHGNSAIAINLIETLYKAGLNSEVVLPVVNKLLSFSNDEDFIALDMVTVDLYKGRATFIKTGAPYGFFIQDEGIKIIDGSSLPLGILEDVETKKCNVDFDGSCTIIMFSDGISDAFTSSTDMLTFIHDHPSLNPQKTADSIMEEAIRLSGGYAKDDLTVIVARIFKKE